MRLALCCLLPVPSAGDLPPSPRPTGLASRQKRRTDVAAAQAGRAARKVKEVAGLDLDDSLFSSSQQLRDDPAPGADPGPAPGPPQQQPQKRRRVSQLMQRLQAQRQGAQAQTGAHEDETDENSCGAENAQPQGAGWRPLPPYPKPGPIQAQFGDAGPGLQTQLAAEALSELPTAWGGSAAASTSAAAAKAAGALKAAALVARSPSRGGALGDVTNAFAAANGAEAEGANASAQHGGAKLAAEAAARLQSPGRQQQASPFKPSPPQQQQQQHESSPLHALPLRRSPLQLQRTSPLQQAGEEAAAGPLVEGPTGAWAGFATPAIAKDPPAAAGAPGARGASLTPIVVLPALRPGAAGTPGPPAGAIKVPAAPATAQAAAGPRVPPSTGHKRYSTLALTPAAGGARAPGAHSRTPPVIAGRVQALAACSGPSGGLTVAAALSSLRKSGARSGAPGRQRRSSGSSSGRRSTSDGASPGLMLWGVGGTPAVAAATEEEALPKNEASRVGEGTLPGGPPVAVAACGATPAAQGAAGARSEPSAAARASNNGAAGGAVTAFSFGTSLSGGGSGAKRPGSAGPGGACGGAETPTLTQKRRRAAGGQEEGARSGGGATAAAAGPWEAAAAEEERGCAPKDGWRTRSTTPTLLFGEAAAEPAAVGRVPPVALPAHGPEPAAAADDSRSNAEPLSPVPCAAKACKQRRPPTPHVPRRSPVQGARGRDWDRASSDEDAAGGEDIVEAATAADAMHAVVQAQQQQQQQQQQPQLQAQQEQPAAAAATPLCTNHTGRRSIGRALAPPATGLKLPKVKRPQPELAAGTPSTEAKHGHAAAAPAAVPSTQQQQQQQQQQQPGEAPVSAGMDAPRQDAHAGDAGPRPASGGARCKVPQVQRPKAAAAAKKRPATVAAAAVATGSKRTAGSVGAAAPRAAAAAGSTAKAAAPAAGAGAAPRPGGRAPRAAPMLLACSSVDDSVSELAAAAAQRLPGGARLCAEVRSWAGSLAF
jgi:hypothetical protein